MPYSYTLTMQKYRDYTQWKLPQFQKLQDRRLNDSQRWALM